MTTHAQQHARKLTFAPLKRHSPDSKAPFLKFPTNLVEYHEGAAQHLNAATEEKKFTSTRSFRSSKSLAHSCCRQPTLLYNC
jgi:hypothetical protein